MAEQNNRYIFLVDDEPIQNEMLKDYIAERFPFTIKTYESGEAAISDMALNPEIVVLDFHLNAHLPEAQDGVAVLKRMKEINPHAEVVMLSGQDKLDVAVESMKHGAYDYVVKGETAFSRMENVINNIIELRSIKAANTSYKKVVALLWAALATVVLISIFLVWKFRSYTS
jgi:two-component system, OmpR family, response regulator